MADIGFAMSCVHCSAIKLLVADDELHREGRTTNIIDVLPLGHLAPHILAHCTNT